MGDGAADGFYWFPSYLPSSWIDRIGRFRQILEWEKKPAPKSGPWHRWHHLKDRMHDQNHSAKWVKSDFFSRAKFMSAKIWCVSVGGVSLMRRRGFSSAEESVRQSAPSSQNCAWVRGQKRIRSSALGAIRLHRARAHQSAMRSFTDTLDLCPRRT
jgi:hypothetical protein